MWLGVLTDAGHVTAHGGHARWLRWPGLECNHDAAMLVQGSYPLALKRRVGGPWGHLDNAAGASLLARLDSSRLRHVVAAHLSEQNNSPLLARAALSAVLGGCARLDRHRDAVEGFSWRDL